MYVCMRAYVRACVIWVREGGTTHMHGHKAFHLQLVSEPTHSYQGGISGNVLPFPPLCWPAWYSSNSDVPERRYSIMYGSNITQKSIIIYIF